MMFEKAQSSQTCCPVHLIFVRGVEVVLQVSNQNCFDREKASGQLQREARRRRSTACRDIHGRGKMVWQLDIFRQKLKMVLLASALSLN